MVHRCRRTVATAYLAPLDVVADQCDETDETQTERAVFSECTVFQRSCVFLKRSGTRRSLVVPRAKHTRPPHSSVSGDGSALLGPRSSFVTVERSGRKVITIIDTSGGCPGGACRCGCIRQNQHCAWKPRCTNLALWPGFMLTSSATRASWPCSDILMRYSKSSYPCSSNWSA